MFGRATAIGALKVARLGLASGVSDSNTLLNRMGCPVVASIGSKGVSSWQAQKQPSREINVRQGHPKYRPSEEIPDTSERAAQSVPLLEHFSELLKKGNLEPNESQRGLMKKLQLLMDEIEIFNRGGGDNFDALTATVPRADVAIGGGENETKRGLLDKLFSLGMRNSANPSPAKSAQYLDELNSLRAVKINPRIRGIYVWGGVGQGKTMIMDAFYDTIDVKSKTRVHFHQFMINVHERLHQLKGQKDVTDPLAEVAKEIRQSCQVLCFDEFQVTHIADAMVLKGLFEALFSFGCIVVATSNRPPTDLYSGGLNRDRFLPFIDLLTECCETFHIDTQKDFRLTKKVNSLSSLYHCPSRDLEAILEQLKRMSGSQFPRSDEIAVGITRTLKVPFCVDGFAIYSFRELCETTAGVADYLAVAKKFHTIFLRDIPCLAPIDERPNEVRRFISLIDILYERHIRVIFDASVPFSRLFGTTAVTDSLQNLRERLAVKYPSLQAFLDEVLEMSGGKQEITSVTLGEAFSKLLGIPTAESEQIFEVLQETYGSPTRITSIRALLLHARDYDATTPASDPFLMGSVEKGDTVGLSAVVPSKQLSILAYDQISDGPSAGAQDNKFSYVRTVSRIREMLSEPYVTKHQRDCSLADYRQLQFTNGIS